MAANRFTSPKIIICYSAVALAVIAALSAGHYFYTATILQSRANDARTINLSGRQRMLSQKIVNLTLVFLETRDTGPRDRTRRKLKETLVTWESMHRDLVRGNPAIGLSAIEDPAIADSFAELDASVGRVKQQALSLIALDPSGEVTHLTDRRAVQELLASAEQYLGKMDETVFKIDRNSEEKLQRLRANELWLLLIVLGALVLEMLLLVRPVARSISRANASLQEAHGRLKDDILKIDLAEETARQSKAFMAAMLANTSEGVITMDIEGRVTLMNPAAETIFGYSDLEATGESAAELFIPAEFRERYTLGLQRFFETGEGAYLGRRFETPALRKDGSVITIEMVINAIRFNDEFFFTSFLRDVTERKQAESSLRQFKTTLDMTLDSIFMFDPHSLKFIYVNRGACKQVGYSPEELLCMTPLDIKPDFEEQPFRKMIAPLLNGEKDAITFETVHRHKNGTEIPVEIALQCVTPAGEEARFVAIVRDATERHLAEEERARLYEGLEHVVESIVITDTDGVIRYVNPAFEQATGFARGEALGKTPRVLKSGKQDRQFYEELWGTITSGKIWKGSFINKRKDGTHYEEEATISPVFDNSGKIINYIAVKRDVTEDRKKEARLRQAEKMQAIGVLSGGIAHDFNNILTPILGFADLAKMTLPGDSEVQRYLGVIRKAAHRAKDLVSRILVFSRQTPGERKPVKMDSLVKEVLDLLRSALSRNIEIRCNIESSVSMVSADVAQLHTVLMNLSANASHAMPNGGVLTVGLEDVTFHNHALSSGQKIGGSFVRLLVSDTGTGMDAETMSRIFEPFYTTKAVGEGTGLGLSIAFGIVEQHNGHLSVQSELGCGTTFEIFLPTIQASLPDDRDTQAPVRVTGHESLLLVDDEPEILAMLKEGLEKLGYRVSAHCEPVAALEFFSKHGQSLDLVVADRTMPKMSGEALIQEMDRIRPGIPIILCTGNPRDLGARRIAELGVRALVQKPYSAAGMAEVIRRVLDPVHIASVNAASSDPASINTAQGAGKA